MKTEAPLVILIVCFGLLLALTKEFTQVTILPKGPPSTPVTIPVVLPTDFAFPTSTPASSPPPVLTPVAGATTAPTHVVIPIATVIVPVPTATPVPEPEIPEIVAIARTWLGVPYLWGGCSHRGVDCSCFYQNVMAAVHISVPRTTTTQIAALRPITRGSERVGDAVFFDNTCTDCGANPTHVGLVIGGGLMIDAGDPVQVENYLSPRWQSHNPRFGRPNGL